MTLRRPRGHSFAITLFIVALLSSVGALTWSKLQVEQRAAAEDDRRLLLLWLARSGASAIQPREELVWHDEVEVRVVVSVTPEPKPSVAKRVVAEASSEGWGSARVEALIEDGRRVEWRETWRRAGAPELQSAIELEP